jgi:hypothetical protein
MTDPKKIREYELSFKIAEKIPSDHRDSAKANSTDTARIKPRIQSSVWWDSEVLTSMSLMTDPTTATPRQIKSSFSVEGCVTNRLAAVPTATCVFPVMMNPFKNEISENVCSCRCYHI